MPYIINEPAAAYQERREKLRKLLAQKEGLVLLFGNFEQDGYPYKQDASFYYFTGILEPASALAIDVATGRTIIFVPNTGGMRANWVSDPIEPTKEQAAKLGVDGVEYLGDSCKGYQCHPFFSEAEYCALIKKIEKTLAEKHPILTLNPKSSYGNLEQRFIVDRLSGILPSLHDNLVDISSEVARLRRKKSKREVELLYKAIEITYSAQIAAAQAIEEGKQEYEVQAALEYVFTAEGATTAFPSIVGSGKNSTVLHYMENNNVLEKGALAVIDIGAQYNFYCADITRTYPVSGKFTDRQKEIYNLVLATQEYIASIAKPGMWLSNKDQPDKSLNHLAKKYLEDKGYGQYFVHGIGHFLGLDVHDVGNYLDPLEPGDVITIEPGIYIPEEELGVRIEDDYWIIEKGAICLSESIPKAADEVEILVARSFSDDN